MNTELQPVHIFIAYSSKDLAFKDEIRKRLRPLQRLGRISIWDNYDIEAGADWDLDIREKLEKADLILLLLSPDALDSDYFYEVEAPIAIRRHQAGTAIAVGVLLRSCELKYTPFGDFTKYELLPKKGYPVTDPIWHNADEAYLSIFRELDILIEKIKVQRAASMLRTARMEKFAQLAKEAKKLIKRAAWPEAEIALNTALQAWETGFQPDYTDLEAMVKQCEDAVEITRSAREQLEREADERNKQAQAIADNKRQEEEAQRALEQAQHERLEREIAQKVQTEKRSAEVDQRQFSSMIGIDFGNTNSCVAILQDGKPTVIPNEEGTHTLPSVIALLDNDIIKVGTSAKRQAVNNSQRTIFSIKRLIGKLYSESSADLSGITYKTVKNSKDEIQIAINNHLQEPVALSAIVLEKMKETAQNYTNRLYTEAVIAVPAYFDVYQRYAIKEAGKLAGLKVNRIVNESTAAALAYGYDKSDKDCHILVYDLGGGGLSVSIVELGGGVVDVKSTKGESRVGGDEFDQAIVDWLADNFKEQENIDLRNFPSVLQRLKEAAEKSKIELSSGITSEIQLPYIAIVEDIPKHLHVKLSRSKFEHLIQKLIARTIDICGIALREAGLNTNDINEVLLVGGSSRIPLVQEELGKFFNKNLNRSLNPDEAVSLGAAIHSGVLNLVLMDVLPFSVGVETWRGINDTIVYANTSLPTKKSGRYTTSIDNQTQVEIHLLLGDRPMAADNYSLGRFILDGIPPARQGVPEIEVTVDIDYYGECTVTALHIGSGKKQTFRIDYSKRLLNTRPIHTQQIAIIK